MAQVVRLRHLAPLAAVLALTATFATAQAPLRLSSCRRRACFEVLNERAPEAKATLGPPESEQPDQTKPPDLIETGR